MPTVDDLAAAVRRALIAASAESDIVEAETFASWNNLLNARLNFTSAIPCNGVEEPKSSSGHGIGITLVLRDPAGGPPRVGFGSETADLSDDGIRVAIDRARRAAVADPDFRSLPRPTAGERTLRHYHDPALMELGNEDLVGAGWQVLEAALRAFRQDERLGIGDDPARAAALRLITGGDVTVLQERMAVASTAMPEPQADESAVLMAFATAMVERDEAKGSGWSATTRLAEFHGTAGRDAAAASVDAMGGVRVPSGEHDVVFGPQAVADLCTYLLAPSLSAGTVYARSSPFNGKLGQQVGVSELQVVDDGAMPGYPGSKGITCEGLPTGRTELIKDGRVCAFLCNWYEAERLRHAPDAAERLGPDLAKHPLALLPRNGFRFGTGGGRRHDRQAGVAATNFIVSSSRPVPRDELLRRVGDGLYIGRIWYTYPVNGLRAADFTCTVVGDSFVIRGGRLAEPLQANALRVNDNLLRVLQSVLGIGPNPRPVLVWAADEITHAPEIAVRGVPCTAITRA